MKIVGLTGGMGSGKTTVSNRFEYLGVPVIDADVISHELTQIGASGYREIVDYFGAGIVRGDGELDRTKLRNLVFNNSGEKRALEAILHPKIRAGMRKRANKLETVYCIFSIPLLIESKQHKTVDRVLVVDAANDKRIAWIKSRSRLSEAEISAIFAAQISTQRRLQLADDVLTNDGTLEALEKQVDKIHHRYLNLWGN
ncbi:MAG: dephospho-CoA kinase [Arenicellales bacterium WSBS_2016_MAG_OTU3]